MVEYVCDYCGKVAVKKKSQIKEHNFCCRECYHKYQSEFLVGDNNKNSIPKKLYYCENCGKEIYGLESQNKNKKHIFCSKDCRFEYDSKTFKGSGNPNYKFGKIVKNCLYCGKEFETTMATIRNNRGKYCSTDCKDKHWSETLSKEPMTQERLKKQGISAMVSQRNKFTKPERIVSEYLDSVNVEYIAQYPMLEKFVVDFFIPSFNIVIEVLGDYWHGNPKKYTNDKLTERQIKAHERDKNRFTCLTEQGYSVYMIWEDDIYKKLEDTMKFISNVDSI